MKRWDTVAIVGVGLIGGSVGLALRERGLARRVVGIGRRESSLADAKHSGCVTDSTTSLAEGVADAEIVVVCTPVDRIVPCVAEITAYAKTGAIITDAGSTKAQIVSEAEAALAGHQKSIAFIGSHPLAGSEKTGPEAARADLFQDRVVVITPTPATSVPATEAITLFWEHLGSTVVRLSPEEHDKALAVTSHLPHLLAAAVSSATPEALLQLTAGGWRDTTRIAAGDPDLWRQIFLANQAHTLLALADFEKVLSRFRQALETADGPLLTSLLAEGKRRRDAVGS